MKANTKRQQIRKFTFSSCEKDAVLDFCKDLKRNFEHSGEFRPCQVCESKTKSGTLYYTDFFVCIMSEEFVVYSLLQSRQDLLCEIAKRISYAYPDSDCLLQIITPNTGAIETREYFLVSDLSAKAKT